MPRRATTASAPAVSAEMTPQKLQDMINKKWPGAMKFADDPIYTIRRLPTGLLALDVRLRGGFARGRHIELYGGYNVGKTAISFNFIAESQRTGKRCGFVDAEGTFDPNFAASHGVDLSQLSLTDQNTLEHGNRVIDYLEAQLRSNLYDVLVLDSIAALLPKAEQESSMEDASMGTEQARLMSKALRKLTAANRNTVLVYINQTRQAIGASAFAKQSVTSGGKAMGYYAGTRLEIVRTENIKRKGDKVNTSTGEIIKADQVAGHRILVRVEKDKTGSAFQSQETTLVYDYGLGAFDPVEDLIYCGRQYGLVKKSGNKWWMAEYSDDKFVGRPRFKKYLRSNPIIAEELKELIEEAAYAEPDEAFEDEDEDGGDEE